MFNVSEETKISVFLILFLTLEIRFELKIAQE